MTDLERRTLWLWITRRLLLILWSVCPLRASIISNSPQLLFCRDPRSWAERDGSHRSPLSLESCAPSSGLTWRRPGPVEYRQIRTLFSRLTWRCWDRPASRPRWPDSAGADGEQPMASPLQLPLLPSLPDAYLVQQCMIVWLNVSSPWLLHHHY